MDSIISFNNQSWFLDKKMPPGLFSSKGIYKSETGETSLIRQILPSFLGISSRKPLSIQSSLEQFKNINQEFKVKVHETGSYTSQSGSQQFIAASEVTKFSIHSILGIFPGRRFPENIANKYFQDLVSYIECLHSHGIYCPTIRLEDLLLDENFKLIVTDYSIGYALMKNSPIGEWVRLLSTSSCLAPEISMSSTSLSKKLNENYLCGYENSDIFNLGHILFNMVIGSKPFKAANISDPYFKLLTTNMKQFWKQIETSVKISLSNDLKDLISSLLCADTSKRISLEGIISHKWITSQDLESPETLIKGFFGKFSKELGNKENLLLYRKEHNIGNNSFIAQTWNIYRSTSMCSTKSDHIEELSMSLYSRHTEQDPIASIKEYTGFHSNPDLTFVVSFKSQSSLMNFYEEISRILLNEYNCSIGENCEIVLKLPSRRLSDITFSSNLYNGMIIPNKGLTRILDDEVFDKNSRCVYVNFYSIGLEEDFICLDCDFVKYRSYEDRKIRFVGDKGNQIKRQKVVMELNYDYNVYYEEVEKVASIIRSELFE